MPLRQAVVRFLDKPVTRGPFAVRGSLLVTGRNREPCLVTPLGDGLFAHRYREGVAVYPGFYGDSASTMRRATLDICCWGYRPQVGDTVLDVGAGIGEEVVTFSRLVGEPGHVVAVEAQPETYRRLMAVCRLNRTPNVTPVQSAITDAPGTVRIQEVVGGDHVGASLTEAAGVEVPAETLDGLTARLGLGTIDLLKMNIEGAERPALLAGSETLGRTRNVVVSCHDFLVALEGADPAEVETYDAVHEVLRTHGFTLSRRPDDPRPWVNDYIYGSR